MIHASVHNSRDISPNITGSYNVGCSNPAISSISSIHNNDETNTGLDAIYLIDLTTVILINI